MKIGYVLPKFVAGGAEQVVLELSKALTGMGHAVEITALASGGDMAAAFYDSHLKCHELGMERHFRLNPQWFWQYMQDHKKLCAFFKAQAYDVIHTHLMGTDVRCLSPAKQSGAAVVCYTIHNVYPKYISKEYFERLRNHRRKTAYRQYDFIFAVDDAVTDWAIDTGMVRPDKIHTVYNGIDLSRMSLKASKAEIRQRLGWKKDTGVLLNVASLTPQKNQRNLIQAIRILVEKGLPVALKIAGTGGLKQELEELIETLRLQAHVELLGYRRDVPDLLKAADTFVLPSHWEGLPISLLEAIAGQTPVAASDIPVHRKILSKGDLGNLIDGTEPEAIADCLIDMWHHTDANKTRAERAKKAIESKFSSLAMAENHLALYQRIIHSS